MVSCSPAFDVMSSNGPRVMYRVKGIHECSLDFQKTDCMYTVKNFYSLEKDTLENSSDLYQDLESRQLQVLKQLEKLSEQVQLIKNEVLSEKPQQPGVTKFPCPGQDIVINANPDQVPLSVWVLCNIVQKQGAKVRLSTHQHSSVQKLPQCAKKMMEFNPTRSRSTQDLSISIIWKNVGCAEMMISPLSQVWIQGEPNIMRFLGECLGTSYRDLEPELSTEIDVWLDKSQFSLLQGNNKERQAFLRSLNSHLGRNKYLSCNSFGIADIVTWSALCQIGLTEGLPSNVQTWWKDLRSLPAFGCLLLENVAC